MKSTITRPYGLGVINDALRPYGLVLDAVLVTPDADINFSRKSSTVAQHAQGFGIVTRELNAVGTALPRAYVVQGNSVVNLAAGDGVTGDETNPNASGMGLVQTAEQIGQDLAVGVTFADAPGALVVHVPTGLLAAVSGIGHLLVEGTVPQTISLMRQQVEALGVPFRTQDLKVILAPGAREGFRIDDAMIDNKLAGIDQAILAEVIIRNYGSGDRPHSLDLSLLFMRLWEAANVTVVDFDERNTLTDEELPSKRAADARGEQFYSSGILAGVVRVL
ncbi:MAG TPA: hypothetical protein VJM46_00740 [Candidatus Saccharimonadales bacterium]|nr:hypothetical protein [Candidatus Saccharimonadales bacterium]